MLNHQKRIKFLQRLRKCESKPKHGHHLTHYHVAITEPKVGGKPFVDLAAELGEEADTLQELRGTDLLESASQGGGGAKADQPGFRYKRPPSVCARGFEAVRAIQNVYAEKLRPDGSYGWLFLYDLITGTIGLSFTSKELSIEQMYPTANASGSVGHSPEAQVDSRAASDWGSLPDASASFQAWAESNGISLGDILNNEEPVQASPRAYWKSSGSAPLTAVPKLLFQLLYLAMKAEITKLAYSPQGPMWKIFALLSHAYDQLMDQLARDAGDGESAVEAQAKQLDAVQRQHAAEAARAANAANAKKLEPSSDRVSGAQEIEAEQDATNTKLGDREGGHLLEGSSDEEDEQDEIGISSWWGKMDMTGADVVEGASVDVEKKGDRAQKTMRLLPRFPFHTNEYTCTHGGLLLGDKGPADQFVQALVLALQWYAYEDGEKLEHRADFRYLAGDRMPAPLRENLESVFLKPTHVRLFNMCMPDITDFAQSRRELNDESFDLRINTHPGHDSANSSSGLALDEEQVRAFASRPLDHLHVLRSKDGAAEKQMTLSDFVSCSRLTRRGKWRKADEGQKVDQHRLELTPPSKQASAACTIAHVDEAVGGEIRLSSGAIFVNPLQVELQEEEALPYTEDVKCIEVDQIIEGGLHDRLPISDVFFRRGAANTFNARKIVERLQHDLRTSAESLSEGFVASMKLLQGETMQQLRRETHDESVTDANAVEKIQATKKMASMLGELNQLLGLLEQEREEDTKKVIDGTATLVELANSSSIKSKKFGTRERLQFQLKRLGGQRAPLHFEFIAASMMSSECAADLQRLNPLLDHVAASHELPKACASILLNTIRLCQTNRAIVHATSLQKDINSLLLQQLRTQVAAELVPHRLLPQPSAGVMSLPGAQLPTEELLRWAMKKASHDPKQAMELVRERCEACASLVRGMTEMQLSTIQDQLEEEGHSEEMRTEKLSGLVRLTMQLSNYVSESAQALLSNLEWARMAMDCTARKCMVPMLQQDLAADVQLEPPVMSGLGSDAALAQLVPSIKASSTHQALVTPSDGGTESPSTGRLGVNLMAAMLHAMTHTSLTLAAELTARRHYMQPKVVERPWTDDEDASLLAWCRLNTAHSPPNLLKDTTWDTALATRTGKESKDRWENVLGAALTLDPKARAWAERKLQPTKWIYDPRFLVFEFLLGFMLRRRQFELVTEFATAALEGRSSVNQVSVNVGPRPVGGGFPAFLAHSSLTHLGAPTQMIMGQGKTTVIAPMLALLLGDGKRLIMQVCPAPLLEMSRSVMRISFSNIIHKRVRTFNFERSSAVGNSLLGLRAQYETLASAREERAVVCSTPEAIKSFFLKYIDNLHKVEAAPWRLVVPQSNLKSRSGKLVQVMETLTR